MATPREIDRMAQNVFNDSLPSGWLIRKQDPDVHIDYFVEIDKKSEPSGVVFGAQLKGTVSPRYSKNYIKISIKTKHLAYYSYKVKQPIFLIVVDVKKRQGFWIFVQKWVKEELKNRPWRDQKKIDVEVPVTNCLSDTQKLREAIANADIYMRELWPSSIPAAVYHEKESLEKLDNRIQVDISYQGGKTSYRLLAKETFDFNIQFKGASQIKNKFNELLDRGKSAIFDTDEVINVKGSPLLESLFDKKGKGQFVIEPARKVKTSFVFSALDCKEKERAVLYGVDGKMWSGNKEGRFEGGLKGSPLKVKLTFPFPPSLNNKPLKANLNFDSSEWQGLRILTLSYFEKLKDFFMSIQEGCNLRIVCEIEGNHIFTATSHTNIDLGFMELTIEHFKILDMVRLIAREIDIDPRYPEGGIISKDEIETILLLHQLIQTGEHRQTGNGVNFRATLLPKDNFFRKFQELTDEHPSGPLVIEPRDQKFKLLGEEFEFGLLRYTLTNPELVTKIQEITKDKEKIYQEGIEIEWSGGIESELIISKA